MNSNQKSKSDVSSLHSIVHKYSEKSHSYRSSKYTFESNNQLTSNKLLALRKLCELFLGSTVNITQGMNSLQKTKFNFVFPNIDKSCLNFVTRTPINGVGQYTNDYIQNYIDQNIIQKLPAWIQKKIKSFTSTELINVRGRVDMLKNPISAENLTNTSIYFDQDLTDSEFKQIKKEIKDLNKNNPILVSKIFVQFDKINNPQHPVF